MVPAWANLHNTLLTPLLYSSITPRQLLQVQAFVWACLWLCKARHKRLISQLFLPPFFFFSSSSSPLPSCLSSLLILVLFLLLLFSRSSTSSISQIQQNEGSQITKTTMQAFFSPLIPLTSAGCMVRFSRQFTIPRFLALTPSHCLSCSSSSSCAPPPSVCISFFSPPFILVILPYYTWAHQEQILSQSFLLSSTCPTQGAPLFSPFFTSSNLKPASRMSRARVWSLETREKKKKKRKCTEMINHPVWLKQ